MARFSDRFQEPGMRPPTRWSGKGVALIPAIVLGYLALLVSVSIALSLAAPTIRAAEGGAVAAGHTTSAGDSHDGTAAVPARAGAAADAAAARAGVAIISRGANTSIGPGPAHPLRPAWGWVVLGLICFAVRLGLAWPDHDDPT